MKVLIAGAIAGAILLILSFTVETCRGPAMIYGSDCLSPDVYKYGIPVVFWLVVIGGFMARAARRREEREEREDDEYYP